MLVLTRKFQQQIKIGDQITVTILRVKGQTVRVGIEAPREVRVVRGELPPEGQSAAAAGEESTAPVSVVLVADDEDDKEAVVKTERPAPLAYRPASRKRAGRMPMPPLRVVMSGASGVLAK